MARRAAVINDLSGLGRCSLGAAISVLSVCGVQTCTIPTAILTNQTGYPTFKSVDFTEHMSDYIGEWKKNHASFDGIYSGYIANSRQVDFISELIEQFKRENTLVLVDPVMGDNGSIYKGYDREMCDRMCHLTAKADFITPNLTELCILTDNDYSQLVNQPKEKMLSSIAAMAYTLGEKNNQAVAVTGVSYDGKISNRVYSDKGEIFVETRCCDVSFSGTGDLFASSFFGKLMCGASVYDALRAASDFIESSVFDTITQSDFDPNDGVEFEKNLYRLMQGGTA